MSKNERAAEGCGGGGANNTTTTSTNTSTSTAAATSSPHQEKPTKKQSSSAASILEGLERRMAGKKDAVGGGGAHVLLPEEDDDDAYTLSSGSEDEHVEQAPRNTAATNVCNITDDENENNVNTMDNNRVAFSSNSPATRRPQRPDNELTFLQGNLYPKEYLKTLFAFVLLLLSALGNGLVIGYIHQLTDVRIPALQDVVFQIVPYQHWAWTVADVMVTVCGVVCLLVSLFHKHNSIVLRRMALLAAVLYLLRALFLLCTYLPPPFPDAHERCLPRWNITGKDGTLEFISRAFSLVFTVGFTGNTGKIMCGDTVYSGHTMIYLLAGMMVWKYCPRPWRPVVPVLTWIFVVTGITAVLISRQHYTIDVVVALFVTISMFYGYHVWCRQRRDRITCGGDMVAAIKAAFTENCCSAVTKRNSLDVTPTARRRFYCRPFYGIFLFFERRVPHGAMPKELAWPFPRPLAMVILFDKWNECGGGNAQNLQGTFQQRRFVKRERQSSSSGSAGCGSRNVLTSSNSGLLAAGTTNGESGRQRQQQLQTNGQNSQGQQTFSTAQSLVERV